MELSLFNHLYPMRNIIAYYNKQLEFYEQQTLFYTCNSTLIHFAANYSINTFFVQMRRFLLTLVMIAILCLVYFIIIAIK